MARKLGRKQTPTDRERIKSLKDQMAESTARLDAALAESKRLTIALDELQRREPLRDLRKTLKKRFRGTCTSDIHTYDPTTPSISRPVVQSGTGVRLRTLPVWELVRPPRKRRVPEL
jgi:hypothetical protein